LATAGDTVLRLIAFYLPQYHPIPENNEWWGEGFTDWLNVVRARPLFPGHQQPHLPADLGFYDLRLAEAREAQAELARAYGIHGFCYYHYWFGGKRLLSQPLDEVLATGKPDFPFCVCWANENWTRAWDGRERKVLMRAISTAEDDREHIIWLTNVLRDPRYIRVDGKPIVLVYRVSKLANPQRTATVWREEAWRLGLGEIFLASVESLKADRADPAICGFDAAVEFQPDWLALGKPSKITLGGTRIYSYNDVVERMLKKATPHYRRFPCVTTSWDNTARRRKGGIVLDGSCPELYEIWLREVLASVEASRAPDPLVFVNAWNEWAEGAHLEPCQRWGHGYLEATRRALRISAVPG
jgi:lipopolysaccharide biosynthesis protein